MIFKKIVLWLFVALFLGLFVIPLIARFALGLVYYEYVLNEGGQDYGRYDYVVVLGAGKDALKERIEKLKEIYDASPEIKIILSGADLPEEHYYESQVMSQYAVRSGIPQEKLIIEKDSYRTLDSCVDLSKRVGQAKTLVITQKYHIVRALFLCRSLGVDAYGSVAGVYSKNNILRIFGNGNWDYLYMEVRDVYASVYAVFDLVSYRLFGKSFDPLF